MDFYRYIKDLSDEELQKVVEEKIQKLQEESYQEGIYVGYHVGHHPNYKLLKEEPTEEQILENLFVEGNRCHKGYVPKGTKTIYGYTYNLDGSITNDGCFYMVDDDSYLLEFCRYIKDKQIETEYDLFDHVLWFLMNYFGTISKIDRDEMLQMIYKDIYSGDVYDPTIERGISQFHRKGNALCSEYSLLAQNILTLFGFDMSLIIGHVKNGDTNEDHAFNMIKFTEEATGDDITAIIDFAYHTRVFNASHKSSGRAVYGIVIEEPVEEKLDAFFNGGEPIKYPDYYYLLFNDEFMQIEYDRNREYTTDCKSISNSVNPEKKLIIERRNIV